MKKKKKKIPETKGLRQQTTMCDPGLDLVPEGTLVDLLVKCE